LQYKGGEEVLPKRFLTAFGLDGYSLADVKERGEKFFTDLIEYRYTLNENLLSSLNGKNYVALACSKFDIVITSESTEGLDFNLVVDELGDVYDVYGNKV